MTAKKADEGVRGAARAAGRRRLPEALRKLDARRSSRIWTGDRRGRRRQGKALAAAGDRALRHVPRLLRGPIRRVDGMSRADGDAPGPGRDPQAGPDARARARPAGLPEALRLADLRALRDQVTDVLWSADGAAWAGWRRRPTLLPAALSATIAERAFGPLTAAGWPDSSSPREPSTWRPSSRPPSWPTWPSSSTRGRASAVDRRDPAAADRPRSPPSWCAAASR